MAKFSTFAPNIRMSILLSCSASVLLTACGGSVDPSGTALLAQPASSSAAITASTPFQFNRSNTQATLSPAELIPAEAATPTAQADQTPAAFNFNGYGDEASSTEGASPAPAAGTEQSTSTEPAGTGTRLLAQSTFQTFASNLIPETPYNLYVATWGDDDNAGTIAAPFKTIGRAAESVVPGTTVHVVPGIYAGGFKTIQQRLVSRKLHARSRFDDEANRHARLKTLDNRVGKVRQLDPIECHIDAGVLGPNRIEQRRVAIFERRIAKPFLR